MQNGSIDTIRADPLSPAQLTALPILRMVFSIPSLIGSGYIIYLTALRVLCNTNSSNSRPTARRRRTGQLEEGDNARRSTTRTEPSIVFFRIMLGMSINDFLFALYGLASQLPAPVDPTGYYRFAIGSSTSCISFGVLGQGSRISTALYSGTLTLYYLLTIQYRWSECRCQQRLEPWVHLVPNLIGWGSAIFPLPLNLYKPKLTGCMASGFWMWCFFVGCVSLVFILSVAAMSILFRSIVQVEEAAYRCRADSVVIRFEAASVSVNTHATAGADAGDANDGTMAQAASTSVGSVASNRPGGSQSSQLQVSSHRQVSPSNSKNKIHSKSRMFAMQAILYCAAFLITWIFPHAQYLYSLITGNLSPTLMFCISIMVPLPGFWNCIIYVWPRYFRKRQQKLRPEERQRRTSDHLPQQLESSVSLPLDLQGSDQGAGTHDDVENNRSQALTMPVVDENESHGGSSNECDEYDDESQ